MKHFPTSIRLPADLRAWLWAYFKRNSQRPTVGIVWVLQQFRAHIEKQEGK